MTFPAGLTLVTVHGRIDSLPSGGASGQVCFTRPYPLVGATDNSIVPPRPEYATLDTTGQFTIVLPATNDPDWTPVNWAYSVEIGTSAGLIRGTVQLDYQSPTVELADVIQVSGAATAGTSYIATSSRGVAGGVAALDVDGDVIDASGDKVTGGGTPSATVAAETGYGQSSAAGVATAYSRGDHTHGTPALGTSGTTAAAGNHAHAGTYDPAGTAAAAVSTHAGLADPHTDYALETDVTTALSAKMAITGGAGFTLANGGVVAEAGGSRMDAGFSGTVEGAGLELYKDDHSTRPGGASFVYGAGAPGVGAVRFIHYDGTDYYVRAECLPDGGVKIYDSAAPATPSGGAVLYAEGGVPKCIDAGGNISTIGAGGISPVVKRAIVTSGDITPQNTAGAWAPLTGGPTLALAAVAGDYISVEVMGMLTDPASTTFIELAVLAGGSLVRYGSTGTGTPAVEGDPAFYPDTANYAGRGGPILDFVATSGDISGGQVTACFAVKSAGAGVIYAGAAFPLRWRVINHGAITVS